ncbi:glycerol transporter [Recurvomyces mirabilis]|uniref:Glycerol transporter n=1 Tax=Recurvomyces mirabilis TaxID=574656 RepID=A0AAE0WT02_9PEZI|nr:glycerol transporter [Recurvomyces mirabilis]KAK5159431.1 glycerol transporter [Recurvomyces mirabilis]
MRLLDMYKVETLDTRFASKNPGEPLPNAQPSKWRTPEYYFYYACFLTIPVFMFKAVYDVSQPSHPGYKKFETLLSDGWIPGRKVDNSDEQYQGFRNNIPYMALLLVAHPLLRQVYDRLAGSNSTGKDNAATADARLRRRTTFDLLFAIVFIVALHGVSSLKILVILWLNYQIATALPKQYVTATTWTFNIAILFANELCRGYRFADILAVTLPPQTTNAGSASTSDLGAWIDSYGGLIPRWEVLFNITVLRLISFNLDHLWMLDRQASSPLERKNLDPTTLSERDRVSLGAHQTEYTFANYLSFILYSPLYLTGPILNFNDYISQSRHPLPSTKRSRIAPYAIRFIICLLTMELVLHYLYAVAISKSHPDWSTYSPFQLSMLGYFNLHIIWLKLLLPWRFFRLWSLIDGIDPPENMVRCMSDNYSVLAFWRGWHRSFNRWIVRYIFIPMGGTGRDVPGWRKAVNYAAVFTFVALWHDINLKLLIWGWLIVLFVLPEVVGRMVFPAKRFKDRPNMYRWLSGAGGVFNILMLMAANLVGFALGLDGLKGLVDGIVSSLGGRVFLLGACMTLFVGVQVMFEWREGEKRRGVDLKC